MGPAEPELAGKADHEGLGGHARHEVHSRGAPSEPVQPFNNDVAQSILETNRQSLELMQKQQTLVMDRDEEKKKKENKVNRLSRRAKQVLIFAQVDSDDVVPSRQFGRNAQRHAQQPAFAVHH